MSFALDDYFGSSYVDFGDNNNTFNWSSDEEDDEHQEDEQKEQIINNEENKDHNLQKNKLNNPSTELEKNTLETANSLPNNITTHIDKPQLKENTNITYIKEESISKKLSISIST